jgi:plastocyanin
MLRRLLLVAAALALAFPLGSPARSTKTTLKGTVGPGFTISLKTLAGKNVKALPRGVYVFRVTDRSSEHNFRITGPGVRKSITTVGFIGTKAPTMLTLKKGKYTFFCVPHALDMRGTFTVT